jgi:hypothetical protein
MDGLMDIGETDGTENDDDSDDYGAEEPDDTHPETMIIAYEKQIDKKRKERDDEKYGEYRSSDLILCSCTEIERVWSAAEKVLTPARFSTHPVLLEAILFLRFNKKYWTQFTVSQAFKLVQKQDLHNRYKKE